MNYLPIVLLVCLLAASFFFGYTPLLLSALYVALGSLTFLFYARDKAAAKKGAWRVSESTLHTFALIGGWPGAIIAQQTLRHKTVKPDFRGVFWITVLFNIGVLIFLHTNQGLPYLHMFTSELSQIILGNMDNGDVRDVLLTLLSYRRQL